MKKYTHSVIRVSTGDNCGDHTSENLAAYRIGRLVAMSNGKLAPKDFKIVPFDNAKKYI